MMNALSGRIGSIIEDVNKKMHMLLILTDMKIHLGKNSI